MFYLHIETSQKRAGPTIISLINKDSYRRLKGHMQVKKSYMQQKLEEYHGKKVGT